MTVLNDENFEREIQNSPKPVLVDFFAAWCQPCLVLAPILEKLAEDFRGKFVLAKVNIEDAPLFAQKFGIDAIPAVMLFKKGKPVGGFAGVLPELQIKEWLEKFLGEDEKENMEKSIQEYENLAQKDGLKLNPNKEIAENIIKGLLENEKKYGKRYCPCRRVTGEAEKDEKIICPCVFREKEIEEKGKCLCGLFVK